MSRAALRAALAIVLAAACGPTHRAGTRSLAPGRAEASPSIVPADADVWAWEIEIGGRLPPGMGSCRVVSGSRSIDARATPGAWSARLPLSAGDNEVHAECVGADRQVHASPTARLRAMLRDAPAATITAVERDGAVELDASGSTPSAGSRAPIVAYAWSTGEDAPRIRVPAAPTRIIELEVRDARGGTDVARIRTGPPPPARGDVVYGIVPPLFGAPPLRAVNDALADLADLGIDVLWMSPVFETTPNDYGYAVTDYFRVRPDYGSPGDLVELVAEAHRRGLRVVLDLVPNHTSDQHRYFRDATVNGSASHYFGFYQRDVDGNAVHYFDWSNLPNLDYFDAEVARWMLEATAHWMRTAKIDGYRVDAAWGIQRRTPTFWDAFRTTTRRLDPDALLVAEASARDPFWREHGFDAAYDWNDELGHWAWEDAFREPDEIADRLDAAVRAAPAHVLRFLENNDTGPRFVTRHGVDLTRVAAAALVTLPGTPSLFTGQERGAEYEPYKRRAPLPSQDPSGLRPTYRALLALRRALPALRGDGYVRVPVEGPDRRTLAYLRWDEGRRSTALVVLRFDARPVRVRVRLPEAASKRARWRERLASPAVVTAKGGVLDVTLAGWAARVLEAAD